MTGGFVKIERSIINWEWYTDIKTFKLFIHLLLKANFVDAAFCGITVSRGQLVSSISSLASETGLSNQEVRTAIQHLKNSGELTSQPQGKYTLFTVINYESYQTDNKEPTEFQQGFNIESTSHQQQYKNNKNNKNDKNDKNSECERATYGTYHNVYLSHEEYSALKRDYSDFEEKIDRLSKYMADTRRTYASHYDTIVKWALKDAPKKEPQKQDSDWDPEEFFRIAVERSMRDLKRS